jgi:hypothetical protein
MRNKLLLYATLLIVFSGCSVVSTQKVSDEKFSSKEKKIIAKAHQSIYDLRSDEFFAPIAQSARIDSIALDESRKNIQLYFNKYLSYLPFRTLNVDKLYRIIYNELGWWYRNYSLEIFTLNTPVEHLVPNYFREDSSVIDKSRTPIVTDSQPVPIVRRLNWPVNPV